MKSLVIIFAVLVVGIIFIVVWEFSSQPTIDQTNYNEISWRLPEDKEIKKMGETFSQSDINICSNYFIKKFEGEKYLIACDSGNGSWIYYTAYVGQKKAYLTPHEFASTIVPPEALAEQAAPQKKESKVSDKKGTSPKTIISK